MGMFDDLIPQETAVEPGAQEPRPQAGMFDDLVPADPDVMEVPLSASFFPDTELSAAPSFFDQIVGAFTNRVERNAGDAFFRGTLAGTGANAASGQELFTPQDAEDFDAMQFTPFDSSEPLAFQLPQVAERAGALTGQILGSIPTPENFLGPFGRVGGKAASTVATRGGNEVLQKVAQEGVEAGLTNLATDPIVQASNISQGVQDEFSVAQTVIGTILGTGIGSGSGAIKGRIAAKKGKLEDELTPDDVAEVIETDPEIREMLLESGVTQEQLDAMSVEFQETAAARIEQRKVQDAEGIDRREARIADQEIINRVEAATGEAPDPAALPSAGRQFDSTPEVIEGGQSRQIPTGDQATIVPGRAVDDGTRRQRN